MTFSLSRDIDGISNCHIISVNEKRKNLLPLGLKIEDSALLEFLKRRLTHNREYFDSFLSYFNVDKTEIENLILISKGLSLNDCYWIAEKEDKSRFKDINLYDNTFNKDISKLAFNGFGKRHFKTKFYLSPEFTLEGMIRKCYRKQNNQIVLYKGGTIGYINSGREPYMEFYASQVADQLSLPHVGYELRKYSNSVCSVCKLFTSKKYGFVPMYRFYMSNDYRKIADYIKEINEKFYEDFISMLIFDALIYNQDRHTGNFGFIAENKTNKLISFAPIYDNGVSLFCYALDKDFNDLKSYSLTRQYALSDSFDEMAKDILTPHHEAMLKKYYEDRPTDLATLETEANTKVNEKKDEAQKNADTNQTSYDDEWNSILDTELSDFKDEKRTEEALYNKYLVEAMKTDIVIVGAGPAGIFTALELIRHGSQKKITII